jgi:cell division protease FtsH
MIYGGLTTGAESDLEELTMIARYMVGRWGMSPEVGMMTVLDGASGQTLAQVDAEVRRIADEAYADVAALLRDERERLDALVEALLVHETLDAEDAYRVVDLERPRRPATEAHPPVAMQEETLLDDQVGP